MNTLNGRKGASPKKAGGSVLLEVVLALALFVAAATIVSSGLRASVQAVDRLRLTAQAEDLAISILSEIQLGIRAIEAGSAQPLPPPFTEWSCEVVASAGTEGVETAPALATVEVIIRHPSTETVRRLTQTIRMPQLISLNSTNEPSSSRSSDSDSGFSDEGGLLP
ncbi:MAG: hypothetical protein ACO1QB_02085 [Verrucomicrobiales bacterium]